MKETVHEIETLLMGVQKTTNQLGIVLGYSVITPQRASTLLHDLVAGRSDIIGAAIALEPGFIGREEDFATYYSWTFKCW